MKNRYGIANQVINLGFYGSVGWWIQLPKPDEIIDYTLFQTEQGNIPCKKETLQKDVASPQREETKKTITFSF